jgi:RNA polymerase sigma-70 factor (ECF subfamily)
MEKRKPQSTPDPLSRDDRRQWVIAALDQFEGRLLRYAQRLLGDLDEARDVVQFVFLRLCDERPEEIGERLAQWLYKVCRNRCVDVVRASGRERSNGKATVGQLVDHGTLGLPFGQPQPPGGSGGQSPPYEAQSREVDPADSVEKTELHALLRELVEDLPTGQREALDLWADGFTYAEIGHITGREEVHVRVLVHRGLKTVREHPQVRALKREDEEGGCGSGRKQLGLPCGQPQPPDDEATVMANKREACSTGK